MGDYEEELRIFIWFIAIVTGGTGFILGLLVTFGLR